MPNFGLWEVLTVLIIAAMPLLLVWIAWAGIPNAIREVKRIWKEEPTDRDNTHH